MKTPIITIFLVFLLVSVSGAGDYWPIGMNSTYVYVNDQGTLLEVSYFEDGSRISRFYYSPDYEVVERMEEDSDGNVFLSYSMGYWDGDVHEHYYLTFDPIIPFISLPLEIGKTWWSMVDAYGLMGPCVAIFYFEVIAEREVVVPAGTFSVIEIQGGSPPDNCPPSPAYLPDGIYLLHREIGPIVLPSGYKLVNINGVVRTQSQTWGTVKALYR